MYAEYVANIFVLINSQADMIAMKQTFESEYIFMFTYEMNVNGKLPILDVMVKMEDGIAK